jgi:hypothetical protein
MRRGPSPAAPTRRGLVRRGTDVPAPAVVHLGEGRQLAVPPVAAPLPRRSEGLVLLFDPMAFFYLSLDLTPEPQGVLHMTPNPKKGVMIGQLFFFPLSCSTFSNV